MLFAIAMLLLPQRPPLASGLDPLQIRQQLDWRFDQDYPQLEALYRDIHAHPELGFQEHRTAALLAARMRRLGFAVTEGVGRTGIVAVYHNGPGPVVLVRTELDALPHEGANGLALSQPGSGTAGRQAHRCRS